jgi:hypothetical protein
VVYVQTESASQAQAHEPEMIQAVVRDNVIYPLFARA